MNELQTLVHPVKMNPNLALAVGCFRPIAVTQHLRNQGRFRARILSGIVQAGLMPISVAGELDISEFLTCSDALRMSLHQRNPNPRRRQSRTPHTGQHRTHPSPTRESHGPPAKCHRCPGDCREMPACICPCLRAGTAARKEFSPRFTDPAECTRARC